DALPRQSAESLHVSEDGALDDSDLYAVVRHLLRASHGHCPVVELELSACHFLPSLTRHDGTDGVADATARSVREGPADWRFATILLLMNSKRAEQARVFCPGVTDSSRQRHRLGGRRFPCGALGAAGRPPHAR